MYSFPFNNGRETRINTFNLKFYTQLSYLLLGIVSWIESLYFLLVKQK